MRFREIEFPMREAWLKWRHNGIGSSDVSSIMGVSRFKDIKQLLEEKSGSVLPEDTSNTYIKERGNQIEFQVRSWFEQKTGKSFSACNTFSTEFPFLRASLDGFSEDKKEIIEIKLLSNFNPSKPNFLAEGYLKWVDARNNVVPPEYLPQIQHQLFITGADFAYFVGYKVVKGETLVTEDKLAIVKVYPDKRDQHDIFLKCCSFWLDVMYNKEKLEQQTKYQGELE